MSSVGSGRRLLAAVVALAAILGCSSPNRGRWEGTFDGSVAGTIELEINARGTKIKGKMTGTTAEGQPFNASMEGTLRQDYLRAEFEGKAGTGFGLPVSFTGAMTGSLDQGQGRGEWSCELWRSAGTLAGTWAITQAE